MKHISYKRQYGMFIIKWVLTLCRHSNYDVSVCKQILRQFCIRRCINFMLMCAGKYVPVSCRCEHVHTRTYIYHACNGKEIYTTTKNFLSFNKTKTARLACNCLNQLYLDFFYTHQTQGWLHTERHIGTIYISTLARPSE
jgi:hypothetical protein